MQGVQSARIQPLPMWSKAMVLLGALTNRVQPSYTVSSNTITASRYGILYGPVENLLVTDNQFLGPAGGCGLASDGGAYLGTAINSNILVQNNTFIRNSFPLVIAGAGQDRVVNMTWQNNTAWGCAMFANGYGWSSNVTCIGNKSLPMNGSQGRIWSSQLAGQYLIDDESNQFPTNMVNLDSNTPTNTVSYANGMCHWIQSVISELRGHPGHQQSATDSSRSLDGHHFYRPVPGRLYFSSQGPAGNSLTLTPGEFVQCQWTNGQWNVIQPAAPAPPQNLHISNP